MEGKPVHRSSAPPRPSPVTENVPGKGEAVGVFRTSGDGHRYRLAWLAGKLGLGEKKIFTIKDDQGNKKPVTANKLMTSLKADYGVRLWEWAEQNYPELKGSEYLKEKLGKMQGISSREARNVTQLAALVKGAGFSLADVNMGQFLDAKGWQAFSKEVRNVEANLLSEPMTELIKIEGVETTGSEKKSEREMCKDAYEKIFAELPKDEQAFLKSPNRSINMATIAPKAEGFKEGFPFLVSHSEQLAACIVLAKRQGKTDAQIEKQLEAIIRQRFNGDTSLQEFRSTIDKWDRAIAAAEKKPTDTLHLIPGGNSVIELYEKYKSEGNLAGIKKLETGPTAAVEVLYGESEYNKVRFKEDRKAAWKEFEGKIVGRTNEGIKPQPMELGAIRAYTMWSNDLPNLRRLEEKSANINSLSLYGPNYDKDFVDWFENDFTKKYEWATLFNEEAKNQFFAKVAEKFWNTSNSEDVKNLKEALTNAAKFLDNIKNAEKNPNISDEGYKAEYAKALNELNFDRIIRLQGMLESS